MARVAEDGEFLEKVSEQQRHVLIRANWLLPLLR
jgi:hypothetical protein